MNFKHNNNENKIKICITSNPSKTHSTKGRLNHGYNKIETNTLEAEKEKDIQVLFQRKSDDKILKDYLQLNLQNTVCMALQSTKTEKVSNGSNNSNISFTCLPKGSKLRKLYNEDSNAILQDISSSDLRTPEIEKRNVTPVLKEIRAKKGVCELEADNSESASDIRVEKSSEFIPTSSKTSYDSVLKFIEDLGDHNYRIRIPKGEPESYSCEICRQIIDKIIKKFIFEQKSKKMLPKRSSSTSEIENPLKVRCPYFMNGQNKKCVTGRIFKNVCKKNTSKPCNCATKTSQSFERNINNKEKSTKILRCYTNTCPYIKDSKCLIEKNISKTYIPKPCSCFSEIIKRIECPALKNSKNIHCYPVIENLQYSCIKSVTSNASVFETHDYPLFKLLKGDKNQQKAYPSCSHTLKDLEVGFNKSIINTNPEIRCIYVRQELTSPKYFYSRQKISEISIDEDLNTVKDRLKLIENQKQNEIQNNQSFEAKKENMDKTEFYIQKKRSLFIIEESPNHERFSLGQNEIKYDKGVQKNQTFDKTSFCANQENPVKQDTDKSANEYNQKKRSFLIIKNNKPERVFLRQNEIKHINSRVSVKYDKNVLLLESKKKNKELKTNQENQTPDNNFCTEVKNKEDELALPKNKCNKNKRCLFIVKNKQNPKRLFLEPNELKYINDRVSVKYDKNLTVSVYPEKFSETSSASKKCQKLSLKIVITETKNKYVMTEKI